MTAFRYKLVSSMCKVFPKEQPDGELKNPRLMGLRGETLSFQIAYVWDGDSREWGNIAVSGTLQTQVRIRAVALVPCAYPCHKRTDSGYLADQPGLYPDLLQELSSSRFPLVSGQWRSLWVTVELEKEQAAGSYPLVFTFTVCGKMYETVVACEVLDAVLPKPSICHTEWFHTDCLADYYQVEVFSERYWEIVEEFVRFAVKHQCNMLLTPVFTPPLDTAVGDERMTVQLVDVLSSGDVYHFGFEKLRRWVEMAERCGIQYFEISHLFTQWGAKAAPKIMAMREGSYVQIFGWDTDASGAAYRAFLHQFLAALKTELAKLGVLERTYFHISDEPQMEHLESYRSAWEGVKADLEGCQVIDALSDYDFYRQGLVQIPVCALDHIEPFLKNRPKRLWGYYCTAQWKDVSNRFMALPGCRTRILGVQMYKYQIEGFLHWGYNFYFSQFSRYPVDPYRCTDADGAFPSGDPFLVYPGRDKKPEGSVRLMLMAEAMMDFAALELLGHLIGRKKVVDMIDEEMELTFTDYPRNEAYLLRLRGKVNDAIRKAVRHGA